MKKTILITLMLVFFAGSAFSCPIYDNYWEDFLSHETMYADFNHLCFSWFGYLDPLPDDYFESCAFQWWGEPVYIGGE